MRFVAKLWVLQQKIFKLILHTGDSFTFRITKPFELESCVHLPQSSYLFPVLGKSQYKAIFSTISHKEKTCSRIKWTRRNGMVVRFASKTLVRGYISIADFYLLRVYFVLFSIFSFYFFSFFITGKVALTPFWDARNARIKVAKSNLRVRFFVA